MLKRTFKIDNSLYPEDKVNEVISHFEGYNIHYPVSWELEIVSEKENPQEIFDEFMNYLLAYLNE